MSLQDALNKLMSDEINDWEQFCDAYLVLTGLQATQSEDIARMKKDRVLLMDGEASAEWLVKSVDHAHISGLKDSLTQKICELGNVPNVSDLGSFGASGVALKFKLISTDTAASKQERTVNKGIQRRLELLYNILRITAPGVGDYTDVKIQFERNFIMLSEDKINEAQTALTRAQTAQMYLDMGVLRPSEIRTGLMENNEFNIENLLDDTPESDLIDDLEFWEGAYSNE